jgi:glycosyltransferase involved in cell wall biosynthesis
LKPQILHLIDSFDEGGSERQALDQVRRLHESGKYQIFLATLKAEGVLRPQIEKLNLGDIPCYPLKSFYGPNALVQLWKFVRYLRRTKIDLLHTHDFYTNIFGMTAGFLAGVKVRIASRRETSGMRTAAQIQLQKAAYALSHQIVANSESVRKKLNEEGIGSERVTVIHSGLDLRRVVPPANVSREETLRRLGVDGATHFVTIVANMRHDVKDYPMFLRAAARVDKAVPNTAFLLAGEGPLQPRLQAMAAQLGISNKTFFLGRCENIAELLNVSDVCVLSSKAEGFSNSILEYMAAGRPVVATDVGGAREAIVENETGFIVPSGNDESMADRVVSLLRDPEKAHAMGERGRQVVEANFSSQALLRNTEALYERLLASLVGTSSRAFSQTAGASPPAQPESLFDLPDKSSQGGLSPKEALVNSDQLRVDQLGVGKAGLPPLSHSEHAERLRILVVAPSLDILGGQAVQAARLIARLRELPSFEVGFLPINPRLPGKLRSLQSIKYLRTLLTSIVYFASLIARVPKYDVIHIFSASYFSFVLAPTPAMLVAKLFGKKVLLNYHSGEADDHFTRWPSALQTLKLADKVVVPSEYLVRVFAKFQVPAVAVNNLIELEDFAFHKRRPLRPIFLSNRNLEKHYGVDHVLRAFAIIQRKIPEAQLTIAGDGPECGTLEALARSLGLQNTTFVGRIEPGRIAAQYKQSHIYLNASEIDNQPLSILEAFACGLPIVTTNAGGIPDMVTDGVSGFVVNRGDHERLAGRAMELLENSELANNMARRGREECQKYSWEKVGDEWRDIYRQLSRAERRHWKKGVKADSNARVAAAHPSTRMRKLLAMSDAELRVRGSQSVAKFLEQKGWSSLTQLSSDKELSKLFTVGSVDPLEHFRARIKPAFFADFDQHEELIAELRSRWPRAEAEIVAAADRAVSGKFDLLGFKGVSFGEDIDWRLEPVSGKRPPSAHWTTIDYLDAEICGDKKIIWELNRHQHFLRLGQAYWLTQDEKYARAFVAQLNSWMDQNPPKQGINWASSLEIAFRSISWLWAFYYFKHSPTLDSATFSRALKFLYLNGRHLETYLSTYFSPNTHLTGEALGLFYLGTILPEFKNASRWRETGLRILVEQLQRQVRPDGVYFEQSSYYQRYTADFYTHLIILSRANQQRLPGFVEERLTALLDHLMFITRPDGRTPLFGDDDGGRLLPLDRRPANDFRATLSTGAVLFGRGDYKFVSARLAEETLWLLGAQAARAFDEIKSEEPAAQSKAFPDGGYYVMRDGWHDRANYLLFDCGPHGTDNCGHAHADALAIEVAARGRPVLVDAGTYTYTGSPELRDLFRGSDAHNVLLVDRQPSSVPAGPFSWQSVAKCEPISWITQRRFDFVSGKHDGYERLAPPATHTRSILFLKNDYWLIRDRVSSVGDHELELRFHLAAGAADEGLLQVASFAPAGSEPARLGRENGWVSNCYGSREAAPVLTFSSAFSSKTGESNELVTLLLPVGNEMPAKFEVREVEAIGGRAFEITSADHRDLFLLRAARSRRVETVRLASDFDLSWARFAAAANGELLELLVLDGQRIELDGKELLTSGRRVEYLVAGRSGDSFRVETGEGLMHLSFPIGNLERHFVSGRERVVKSEI